MLTMGRPTKYNAQVLLSLLGIGSDCEVVDMVRVFAVV